MTTLSDPLTLPGGAVLANRIGKAALSERLGDEARRPTEALMRLWDQWAVGGAGLLITGNVMVDRNHLGEIGNVVLDDESPLERFSEWARRSKAGGSPVWMQLNHPGAQTPRFTDPRPEAPSDVACEAAPGVFATPTPMTDARIHELVAAWARAATLAVEAGFDGVQIHGAHGYLISQFLSGRMNTRTDAWGGDAERRRAFLLAVVDAVVEAIGDRASVGLKLNSADFQRGGFTEEEALDVIRALEGRGLDLLEISGGTYSSTKMVQDDALPDSTRRREAYFADFATKVRGFSSIPLMLTGGFRSVEGIDAALEDGAIDMAGLGRPMCVEPDLPRRLVEGTAERAMVIKLMTGFKLIDSAIGTGWYQAQLQRMGQGKDPDPNMSRLRAVWTYLRSGEVKRGRRARRSAA